MCLVAHTKQSAWTHVKRHLTITRVRQAIRLCVDRPGVLQAVLQGVGEEGNDHPIPTFNQFAADIPLKERNVEEAKALLAEAGYADGLDLTLTTSTVRAGMVEFATAVQAMCSEAGINIILDSAPPGDTAPCDSGPKCHARRYCHQAGRTGFGSPLDCVLW